MSWKMFTKACEYCQALNLHNLDKFSPEEFSGMHGGGGSSSVTPHPAEQISGETREQRRKDVWEMIQIDLFFRLTHDMPAVITNIPWNVNLPWLAADATLLPDATESIVFIMSSKISLVTARFFAMMDETGCSLETTMVRAEAFAREILAIYDEYPTVSSVLFS